MIRCPTPVTDVWVDKRTAEVLRIEHGYDREGLLVRHHLKKSD